MRFTLVVPGLLDWPSSALGGVENSAPALARLVAAGGAPLTEPDGSIAIACRVCGIAKQQDWPVAPWLARAEGIDPGSGYWFCAEPSRLVVGTSDVRLGGLIEDLDSADAASLLATLNTHSAAEGIRFVAPAPSHWFAFTEHPPRISTRPPEAAFGASLLAYLAAGPDGARWRRWQNDVQMLLFEHAVNQRRKASARAPVDSVWLWGGGTLVAPAARATRVFAEGGLVCALAKSAGLALAPLPATFAALADGNSPVAWLGAIEADAAGATLSAIESAWIAPAERALHAGALGEVELVLTGRALALDFRVPRPSFRQRWRQRFVPPQVSSQLTRWIAEASPT